MKLYRTTGAAAASAGALLLLLAGGTVASAMPAPGPATVTIHGTEFFPADGGPGSITFVAAGGPFGSGTSGTGEILSSAPVGKSQTAFRGVDRFTTASGTLTFRWRLDCAVPTPTAQECRGRWHIVDSSGSYAGAQGGGSVFDVFTTDAVGNTTGDDTWSGKIRLPHGQSLRIRPVIRNATGRP